MPETPALLTLQRHQADKQSDPDSGFDTTTLALAGCRLIHPRPGEVYRVRRGLLRVSELLRDGREITRAVLRSGSGFRVRTRETKEADPTQDTYDVGRMIIMALDRTEVLRTTTTHPEGTPAHHVRV